MHANSAHDDLRAREFMRLFSKHESRIRGYILGLVPRWPDCEEILAETNLKLWSRFDQFDRSKDFGVWARSIAHYEVLTFRKKQARQKLVYDDMTIELLADEQAADRWDDQSLQQALVTCLQRLRAESRELIRQVYAGDEKTKEVAERLGRPASSVYSQVCRIRHSLHKCIERTLSNEEAGQ